MDTQDAFFAPAEDISSDALIDVIKSISSNPVVDGLMKSVNGLLVVLNEERQVLGINDTMLEMLGLESVESVLGLRLGEVVGCVNANGFPNGCGTTELCVTCGAAIAMATSLDQDVQVTQECAISANRGGNISDIFLRVTSQPIQFHKRRFLLLFLNDITRQQQLASLERVFYHDIKNLILGLTLTSKFMLEQDGEDLMENAKIVHDLITQLSQELEIQRNLVEGSNQTYHPVFQTITAGRVAQEIRNIHANHPIIRKTQLQISDDIPDLTFVTDISLVKRVLTNMMVNAAEASEVGEEIKIWLGTESDSISFYVWNRQAIPDDISKRVFQRNFSTKEGKGRGLGTFSMKLFGENILQGCVSFTTTREKGTTFCFTLPR